jgi:hypothetical protein
MRKVGLLLGLALVGFACADSVGQMLQDAGQMMQDGSVPDAGAQDETVTCNKSKTKSGEGVSITYTWAEFEVDPGVSEVTTCDKGQSSPTEYTHPTFERATCYRGIASWYHGTSTGFVHCGQLFDYVDPGLSDFDTRDQIISITVHR